MAPKQKTASSFKEECRSIAASTFQNDFFQVDDRIFRKLVDVLNTKAMIHRRMKKIHQAEENLNIELKNSEQKIKSKKEEIWKAEKEGKQGRSMIIAKEDLEFLERKYRTMLSETRCYKVNELISQQIEMYNYGFTASKFALPTPGLYLAYLIQYRINFKYLKKSLNRDLETRLDWGYYLPNEEGELEYTSNYSRKHNTFLQEYDGLARIQKKVKARENDQEKDQEKNQEKVFLVARKCRRHAFDKNESADPYNKR